MPTFWPGRSSGCTATASTGSWWQWCRKCYGSQPSQRRTLTRLAYEVGLEPGPVVISVEAENTKSPSSPAGKRVGRGQCCDSDPADVARSAQGRTGGLHRGRCSMLSVFSSSCVRRRVRQDGPLWLNGVYVDCEPRRIEVHWRRRGCGCKRDRRRSGRCPSQAPSHGAHRPGRPTTYEPLVAPQTPSSEITGPRICRLWESRPHLVAGRHR